jgi:glycosyltransferase involved in cell wall biosynthesis
MRLLVATFDLPSFPSVRLRLLDPLSVAGGFEVKPAFEPNASGGFVFRNDLIAWADAIVTQRGFPRPETRAVRSALLASGKPLVYETDDCLPEIPDFIRKPHYRAWGPDIHDWAGRVDAVTVPTPELAAYFAPHASRVEILPNLVTARTRPEALARRPSTSGPIHIGYAGNPGHRGDLAMVVPALLRILERRPEVHLHFFGAVPDGFPAHERVGVTAVDFNYDAFPARLASFGWHFALAPLVDNTFNRCVSPLKYYEYGALAIPGIFSPRPAYAQVRDGETGLIAADDAAAWEAAIDRLCDDVELRERLAANAHRDVRERYLLEPQAQRWAGFYRSLRKVATPTR